MRTVPADLLLDYKNPQVSQFVVFIKLLGNLEFQQWIEAKKKAQSPT